MLTAGAGVALERLAEEEVGVDRLAQPADERPRLAAVVAGVVPPR